MGSSSSCSDTDSSYCFNRSDGSVDLNLYRVFIFSVPIFFTFVLFFFLYLFCLRPRRLHWTTPFGIPNHELDNAISTSHSGLDKELREMLPILVYNESFLVKDTLCSVCLLEYQAEDRLQQIPACGHTFHMSCIDLWLASHSTCPLCRLSLLTSIKSSTDTSNVPEDRPHNDEETQAMELSESRSTRHQETTVLQSVSGEVAISASHIDAEGPNVLISQ